MVQDTFKFIVEKMDRKDRINSYPVDETANPIVMQEDVVNNIESIDTSILIIVHDTLYELSSGDTVYYRPHINYFDFGWQNLPILAISKNIDGQTTITDNQRPDIQILTDCRGGGSSSPIRDDISYFIDGIGLIYSKHHISYRQSIIETYLLTRYNDADVNVTEYIPGIDTTIYYKLKIHSANLEKKSGITPMNNGRFFDLLGKVVSGNKLRAGSFQARIQHTNRKAMVSIGQIK
jgi:hypothetical protein